MSRRVKRNKKAGPSVEDEEDIWEFLHENLCRTEAFGDATDALFEKFLRENPAKQWQVKELVEYFNETMLAALYKCQLLPEKILELYKKLEIKISEHVERVLEAKCGATIRLDSDRCIHSYQIFAAQNPTTTYSRPEVPRAEVPRAEVPRPEIPRPEPTIPHDMSVPEEFEAKMFDHIFSNFTHLTKPLLMSASFWDRLIAEEQDPSIRSAKLLIHHFSTKMLPNLYHQIADAHSKLWIYQMMEWQLDPAQRRWFEEKEKMELVMNVDGSLKSWKRTEWPVKTAPAPSAPAVRSLATWVPRNTQGAGPNVPSTSRSVPAPRPISPDSLPRHRNVKVEELDDNYEEDDSKHFPRIYSISGVKTRGAFTLEDKMNGWKYVLKRMKRAVRNGEDSVLPKGLKFWRDYVRETNSRRSADNWCSHFRKYMAPALHEMPINRKNMLFLYKYIEIKVDDRLHKLLERKCDAKVQVANEQVYSFKLLNRDEEGEEEQAAVASEGDEDPEEEEPNPADVRIDEESDSEEEEVETIDYDTTLPMAQEDDPHEVTIQPLGDSIDQEHQPEEAPEDVAMIPLPEEQRAQDFRTPEPSQAAGNLEADSSRLGSSRRRSIRKSMSIRAKPTCSVRKSSRKRSLSNPERVEVEEDERSVSPVVTRRSLRNSDQRTPKKSTVRIPQVRQICESEEVEEEEEPEHEFMAPEFDGNLESLEITDSVIPDSVAPNSVPIDFVEQSGDIFEPSTTPIQLLEDVPSSSGEPKVLDLKKVLPGNEFMEISTLLQLVQMTLDENCSDDAILQMPEAILEAFHRENWDMDGTPSASAYASAEMVVRENTDGEMRRSLLKNMDSLMRKTSANVENRLVFEKRKEAVTKALKKCADEERASTSSKK
ncbi:hypothetical protein L3Y34_017441 [Caenorhabditis briggsae]|uniref:SPK domain-containing protein n=2 Tax=Caenorhabditis briggsae TaxID=6238 RepID=A0AAE9DIV9_CAEBR|nr:hypothetical protein L3Y34_017441 [Caenorhabditis briggsae]